VMWHGPLLSKLARLGPEQVTEFVELDEVGRFQAISPLLLLSRLARVAKLVGRRGVGRVD
jgi:hypothetical protein